MLRMDAMTFFSLKDSFIFVRVLSMLDVVDIASAVGTKLRTAYRSLTQHSETKVC